jgi:hypothetical protein
MLRLGGGIPNLRLSNMIETNTMTTEKVAKLRNDFKNKNVK